MAGYVLQRFIGLIPVLLGVSALAFFLIHLVPGGPARAMLGDKATPESVERLNRENGWDQPLPVQYIDFLYRNVVRLDPGDSFLRRKPIREELPRHFAATAELALCAILLASVVGILAGVISAVKKNTVFDYCAMTFTLFGISIPVFFLGLLLILVFGTLLPSGGRLNVVYDIETVTGFHLIDALLAGDLTLFFDAAAHLVLPALALSTIPMAMIARMTRASMLEVLGSDYIRTARAKGLSGVQVVVKHALRNAFVPIVTAVGLQTGYLLAGAVLTESLFQWPGLGKYVVDAVLGRDYNIVQTGVMLTALIFVCVNLAVDISYAFLNPKIRYGSAP